MKFIILFFLLSSLAHANCIDSVDNTNVYYVNGMFTNQKSYNKNMVELQKFVSNHLNVGEVNISSSGSWNPSEPFLEQFKQVALQKFTELNVNQTVQDNIAKTFSGFSVARTSQQSAQETTDVMAAVRYTIGALPSNYDNDFSLADFTGHSLIVSYLEKYGQANLAASSISHIVSQQYPPPISEQHSSNSSAMSSYGYSYLSQILDIKFKDSSVYRYNYVPSDVFESFEIAESQGAFLNTEIKGIYPYIKLSE